MEEEGIVYFFSHREDATMRIVPTRGKSQASALRRIDFDSREPRTRPLFRWQTTQESAPRNSHAPADQERFRVAEDRVSYPVAR